MEWQIIETAPKDGTRVLVYVPKHGVFSSEFKFGCWQLPIWGSPALEPSHWMPLPPDPQEATQ